MDFEPTLTIVLALIPVFLGTLWMVPRISFDGIRFLGVMTIGVLGGGLLYMQSAFDTDPTLMFLAGAILFAAFCAVLGQEDTEKASVVCASIMIVLGLGLGTLLYKELMSRILLSGLLAYVAIFCFRKNQGPVRSGLTLLHIGTAIALSLGSAFMEGDALTLFASLLIAVTFLPLAPFHLPFLGTIEGTKGAVSSFWVVVWLAIGLAELDTLYPSLTAGTLYNLSLLALASAVYASFACLGQPQCNRFVASATVAHVALIWGLLEVFPSFSKWGVHFGIALAFIMGGLCLAFSFIRYRYGWRIIGKLPGLAAPMPRFGTVMTIVVAFALILPLFSTFSGLRIMPSIATQDVAIGRVMMMFFVVWLGGGWYFSRMLHHTAFGKARTDVPYTDLRIAEVVAISVLLLGATYSGLLY